MTDTDTSLMWSGPGRALDAHLELFRYVDGAWKFLRTHAGSPIQVAALSPTVRQRLMLMTSFSENKMELQIDGQSVSSRRDDVTEWKSRYNIERASKLLGMEWLTLNEGETHYVSHHVMATLEAATETMEDEPLFATDMPAPSGLIVLEYPLTLPDMHPETGELTPELLMPVRAIGWKTHAVNVRNPETGELTEHDGVHYTMYCDEASFQRIFVTATRRLLGDDKADVYLDADYVRMWATDATGWAFGVPWKTGYDPSLPFGQGTVPENVAKLRRWLLAYFRWTWQRILVPERYSPRKHERRRAQRMGHPVSDDHIKVLRLRREVEAERHGHSSESSFVYTTQWVVRGHWRRQWYRSLGPARLEDGSFNAESHRLIHIDPHLAGNPFGPLVSGHNVVAAVR